MAEQVLLELWVPGEPVPQGSMQAFVPLHPKTKQPYRRDGGGIVVNVKASNEKALKPWRAKIAEFAAGAWSEEPLTDVSLMVEADFFLKRRENDWGTGRNAAVLKPHAEAAPAQDPDVDKLLRAVLDGLTGVLWHDDNLVTLAVAEKHYAVPSERGDGQGVALKVLRREVQVAEFLPIEQQRRVAPGESQLALT
jgi:Holliday junction resolvase RusA-like endonuclease